MALDDSGSGRNWCKIDLLFSYSIFRRFPLGSGIHRSPRCFAHLVFCGLRCRSLIILVSASVSVNLCFPRPRQTAWVNLHH